MLDTMPGKVGAVSVVVGGITATLTASNVREWLELATEYGPLLLLVILFLAVYQLQQEHKQCRNDVVSLYSAINDANYKVLELTAKCSACPNGKDAR